MRFYLAIAVCVVLAQLCSFVHGSRFVDTNEGASAKFKRVKKIDELWRFQVGASKTGLDLGTTHICIITSANKFWGTSQGTVVANNAQCKGFQRYRVELTNGKFYIQSHNDGEYLTCEENGDVDFRKAKKAWQAFDIYIDSTQQKISFYNPSLKKFLQSSQAKLRCDYQKDTTKETQFGGWKTGAAIEWQPSEEGRRIQFFDNSKGTRAKTFSYNKTIGFKVSTKRKAGVAVKTVTIEGGPALKERFKPFKSMQEIKWMSLGPNVWKKASQIKATLKVDPNTAVKVYQMVGTYGPLDIYSDIIFAAET